jgi:hypothetical protein
MFANAEDVEADPIGEFNLFQRMCMRSTGLSVKPLAGSEMAAATLSIPICIYVSSPGNLS